MSRKKNDDLSQMQTEQENVLLIAENIGIDDPMGAVSSAAPDEAAMPSPDMEQVQSASTSTEVSNEREIAPGGMGGDWGVPDTVGKEPLLENPPTSVSLDEEEPPMMSQTDTDIDSLAPKPAAKKAKARTTKAKAVKPTDNPMQEEPPKSQNAHQAFYSLDFRALDRDLSPEQEQEWNAIYASFRSRSILTGTVIGVDDHTFDITEEDGTVQRRSVRSLVIIGYRVKVMIPETEVWAAGEENPRYAIRGMVGAKVDYVIMSVDRENDCAIASRRMAMTKRRRHTLQTAHSGRELLTCDTLMVSRKAMLANCGGFDLVLTQKDLSYTAIADLRSEYRPGMELRARLLDIRDGKPVVSVKEVNPNPFDGADQRHPVGCRRQAVIEGKYGGGVFCRLPDDTTCLCLYSNNHYDAAFETGDTVLVHITEFNYTRKLIYGRIVGKR